MDKEQLSEGETKQDGIYGDRQKKKIFLRVCSHSYFICNWHFFASNLEVMFWFLEE